MADLLKQLIAATSGTTLSGWSSGHTQHPTSAPLHIDAKGATVAFWQAIDARASLISCIPATQSCSRSMPAARTGANARSTSRVPGRPGAPSPRGPPRRAAATVAGPVTWPRSTPIRRWPFAGCERRSVTSRSSRCGRGSRGRATLPWLASQQLALTVEAPMAPAGPPVKGGSSRPPVGAALDRPAGTGMAPGPVG
jgi:hypothetical protein